jgi:hypothetical protein
VPGYRYQANNLLLTALVPGPHELSGDDLQHVLKLDVDDKIMLYNEGIVVKTPLYPAGLSSTPYNICFPSTHTIMFCKVVEFVLPVSRFRWITPLSADAQVTLIKGATPTFVRDVQLRGRFFPTEA